MPKPPPLPPSARKVFWLAVLSLTAYGACRAFFGTLLPSTAASNLPPQNLAVLSGSLSCALFLYWLGRLRYNGPTLRNLPGSWIAGSVAGLGLATAATFLQWHRLATDLDPKTALPRAAGLVVALSVASCEEFGFRGVLFLSAKEMTGKRRNGLALVVGSLGFALVHAGYQTPWNLAFAAAAGLALGVARLRGASLGLLVAAHTLMDAVDPLWLSPSLTLGYWPGISAAVAALGTALILWSLPAPESGS